MIPVNKTYLPDISEYFEHLHQIWDKAWVTNHGPLVQQLEAELKQWLGVQHLQTVSNGTIALQVAIKAFDLKGEIITTPFSYVATTSAILWENCAPVYVDIDPATCCLDASKIEEAITPATSAIMPTHVYGNPCDVEAIEAIAHKHNLKVIYDAAHAFGVKYQGKSLLAFGDISTVSFHATKLYHTIEGGGIVTNSRAKHNEIFYLKAFGHKEDNHISLGVNGKLSEVHAAMGLCNLKRIEAYIAKRKSLTGLYADRLQYSQVTMMTPVAETEPNYCYLPVFTETEDRLLFLIEKLNKAEIFPRRYFYPSLNKLPYLKEQFHCPISEDLSSRVMCLPLYYELAEAEVDQVCDVILKA